MYNIEEISIESDWKSQREQFDALAGSYFTRRYSWMSAWWTAYKAPTTKLRIIKVSDAGQALAYLPLYFDTTNDTLNLIGSGRACSDDLGVYIQAGHEAPVARAIANYLYETGAAGQWSYLRLEGVRNNCVAMNVFLLEMRNTFGASFFEETDQLCRVIKHDGSLENYFSKCVSHSQRSKLKRDLKNHLDCPRVTVKVADSLQLAREQSIIICDLHRARWQSKGEAGCTADIQFQNLINKSVESLYHDGRWFSIVLEIDGKVAAGLLGSQNDTHVSIYVSGMDPDQTEFRPGVLINLAAIRYSCQQGCTHYDLMRGDESYKSRMGAQPVQQYVWSTSAPRLVPRLMGRVKSTRTALKQWFKQYRDAEQPSA